jgi:hypothetical protein
MLLCLDRRTGKSLWERRGAPPRPLEQKHDLNSYASASPVTDGRHVWVSFLEQPRAVLACFDADGTEVWRRRPGEFHSMHGFCSSPVLYKDLVILNATRTRSIRCRLRPGYRGRALAHRPPEQDAVLLHRRLIREMAGRTQMVLTGSKSVASYDPDTGRQNMGDGRPDRAVRRQPVTSTACCSSRPGSPTSTCSGSTPEAQAT